MTESVDHQHKIVERRSNDSLVVLLMQEVKGQITDLDNKLSQHIEREDVWLDNTIKSAFPGGDAVGHRAAHEAQMKAVLDRAEFWSKMRFEIVKYGLIGFIGWCAVKLWLALLEGPK